MSPSLSSLAREGEKDKEGNLYVGADVKEGGRVSQLVTRERSERDGGDDVCKEYRVRWTERLS